MPEKINIVSPNGKVFQGTREELEHLQLLGGYKEETPDEQLERQTEDYKENYYNTPGQKAIATLEGVNSALTGGLTDIGSENEASKYNSEYRLGGEIAGAIGGAIAGVGTPGLATKAGLGVSKAVGGGIKGAVAFGAIEGAEAGLQSTISTSTLNNDPLTVDSIRAGIGYGALFGGALGGTFNLVGKGLGRVGDKLQPATELDVVESKFKLPAQYEEGSSILDKSRYTPPPIPKTVTREVKELLSPIDNESFKGLNQTIREFSANGSRLGEDLQAAVQKAADDYSASFIGPEVAAGAYQKLNTVADDVGADAFLKGLAGKELGMMKTVARKAAEAVDSGNYERAAEALKQYNNSIKKVASITGYKVDELVLPQVADRTALQAAIKSAGRAVETQAAARTLDAFPRTATEFARMSPNKSEKMFAAIDNIISDQSDELMPLRQSLQMNVEDMVKKSGIVTEGNVVDQLREVYRVAKVTPSDELIFTIKETIGGGGKKFGKVPTVLDASEESLDVAKKQPKKGGFAEDIGDHFAAKFTGGAAGYAVAGPVGGALGYYGTRAILHNTETLSGIKNAVQNKLSQAAKGTGKILQSKAATFTAAKLEPLYLRIDGTEDKTKKKTIEERAKDRITEITEVAPAAKEIFYKAFEPLLASHPDFVAALHSQAVQGFNTFLDMIPKDPGMAISGGKSLWKPNSVQAVQFAKMYEAFMTPMHVMVDMLTDFANVDPIKVNTIKAVYPPLYAYMRGEVLQNVNFSQMDYRTQAKATILLEYDIDSSFSTMNIAESQRIFMETPQPPESGGNRGGTPGNRGGSAEPPTAAQSLT